MSSRPVFATVPEYLSALEALQRKVLKQVLAIARKAAPGTTSVISYGIPALKKQKVFVYCAAFKKHVGVYPPVRGDAALAAALKPYANAKGNLSFALDAPLPAALIARVVKNLQKNLA